MIQWIREETFHELNTIPHQFFYYASHLNPEWRDVRLDPERFPDLYQYFGQGGQLLHRANDKGELELIVLLDSDIDSSLVSKSRWGMEIVEAQNNRFEFHLLIFDREDDPLRLPFIFDLSDSVHRYRAGALCEQPQIPVYFLIVEQDELYVTYCGMVSWPDRIREQLRKAVLKAYLNEVDSIDEIDEDSDNGLLASQLNDEELTANGWTYQFDKEVLISSYGEEGSIDYILERVMESLKLLAKHKNSGIRKGPFLVWAKEKTILKRFNEFVPGIVIFITPFYHERVKRANSEIEPIYNFISKSTGFIRAESGNPIFEGALPIWRYDNGEVQDVTIDHDFLEYAAERLDQMIKWNSDFGLDPSYPNHYRELLNGNRE